MTALTDERVQSLEVVLELLRHGQAKTRTELVNRSGFGRAVVNERLDQLRAIGLLEDGPLGESNGGRAPRELHFRSNAGIVLAAELGATGIAAGITDLSGRVLASRTGAADIGDGPETIMARMEALFDELLGDVPASKSVWGIGVGLPGPVEYSTGRPASPPIMPGWDGYPVRERLRDRFGAPVWVDNDVNVLALGELRGGAARDEQDFLYVKIGTGVGAGLVSGGRLHRGSLGCAGDVGHVPVSEESHVVCRCGKLGCLEALAGGAALVLQATALAEGGRSPFLADVLTRNGRITADDLRTATHRGDRASVELVLAAGAHIGTMLATLVSFFNPSVVLIGGRISALLGDLLLNTIREVVYRRSLSLATRDLRLVPSTQGDLAGLMGAGALVADAIFSARALGAWLDSGTPAGLMQRTA